MRKKKDLLSKIALEIEKTQIPPIKKANPKEDLKLDLSPLFGAAFGFNLKSNGLCYSEIQPDNFTFPIAVITVVTPIELKKLFRGCGRFEISGTTEGKFIQKFKIIADDSHLLIIVGEDARLMEELARHPEFVARCWNILKIHQVE